MAKQSGGHDGRNGKRGEGSREVKLTLYFPGVLGMAGGWFVDLVSASRSRAFWRTRSKMAVAEVTTDKS